MKNRNFVSLDLSSVHHRQFPSSSAGQSFARSKEINKAGYIASILVYAKFSPHKLKTEKRTAENIQSSTSFTSTAFTKISFSDDQQQQPVATTATGEPKQRRSGSDCQRSERERQPVCSEPLRGQDSLTTRGHH
jgi:hypothetical protein